VFAETFFDPENEWPTRKMSEVAELINGDRSANYPSGTDIVDQGVLFVSTKNIVQSKLNLDTSAFIREEKFKSLTRGKLKRSDLIVTLRGSVGQAAIFDCEHDTGFINAQLMIIRPGEEVQPNYLHHLFCHPQFQGELLAAQSGSAVPQLTAGQIGRMEIPVPPIDVQRRFDRQCVAVENLRTKLANDSDSAKDLFAALSQRAFADNL
jgi:type I restriction enzyme S subunit